jgi:hypothetical protein
VFAPWAFVSWYRIPALMEQFRPANGGLLDGILLGVKLSSGTPAIVLGILLSLFAASSLWKEAHSADAIKTASLFMILFLVFVCIDLFMALFVIGYCGVSPHH